MSEIKTLKQFYELMHTTINVKKDIVNKYLHNESIIPEMWLPLSKALSSLESIPSQNNQYILSLNDQNNINLDLSYEINELKKDIFFLEHSEDEFISYLENIHPDFSSKISAGFAKFKNIKFKNFITDRDGTVNNYCGRYSSSVQSIYNAIYLTRFSKNNVENSIILTSAPLDNIGLADISVSPKNVFIYAGSKGREYFNKKGDRCQFPIEKEKQNILNKLNKKLFDLLNQPEYQMFTLIGSGLQFKFGQTTIARQDISKSIPDNKSKDFLELIKKLVKEIDINNDSFIIEDTGKDIEIILTIDTEGDENKSKDFDKGDGIKFLDKDLTLGLKDGPNLICGDTSSDVPMLTTSMEMTKNTYSIFVTKDESLKEKVENLCPNSLIVPEPDILVGILNKLAG